MQSGGTSGDGRADLPRDGGESPSAAGQQPSEARARRGKVSGEAGLRRRSGAVMSRTPRPGQLLQDAGHPDDPTSLASSPARLNTLVVPQDIDPPVETRQQVLPFEQLAWENFERLCLRLARQRGVVEHSVDRAAGDVETGRMSARDARTQGRLYGTRGQKQQGIDLYVRASQLAVEGGDAGQRRYLSLQSRRIASLTAAGLKKAVTEFLTGSWASVSRVFVYATSLSAVRTELADEIKAQAARLACEGTVFEVWDAEELSLQLKQQPRLVDDFFGRAWVEKFCESGAATALGARLDAEQVGAFRKKLGGFYATVFDITDSGMVALRRSDAPRLSFHERFVLPDVVATSLSGPFATTSTIGPEHGGLTDAAVDATPKSHDPTALYQQVAYARYGRTDSALWGSLTIPVPLQNSA